MNLLMVRHGEILSNIKKVYAGRSAEELTERGLAQAREVAGKLKHYDVHALYSSPVRRAVRTARIIGETIGRDTVIEDEFREMEMGPWEGMSEKDIARLYPEEWRIWQNRPAELKLSGRETLDDLLIRVLKGFENISRDVGDHIVVAVTHVAVIRVLLLWQERKSLNLYKTIHVPNAGIFKIKIDPRYQSL